MRYLFLFAHPDDETIACAGTIKRLVEAGDEVIVVSATDGGAGEVASESQAALAAAGSIGALRRLELQAAAEFLGITELQFLEFADGQITNQLVWNELRQQFIAVIEKYRPDVVVTFDHSGWYFHLDHIGVSIAATLAVKEAKHQPDIFFLSHMPVNPDRWPYVFAETHPITHVVDISAHRHIKLKAIELHGSQNLEFQKQRVTGDAQHLELFQLVRASERGKEMLAAHPVFIRSERSLS